jgi:hypothetical protein
MRLTSDDSERSLRLAQALAGELAGAAEVRIANITQDPILAVLVTTL